MLTVLMVHSVHTFNSWNCVLFQERRISLMNWTWFLFAGRNQKLWLNLHWAWSGCGLFIVQIVNWSKMFFVFSDKEKGHTKTEKVGVFRVFDARQSSEITLTWEHLLLSPVDIKATFTLLRFCFKAHDFGLVYMSYTPYEKQKGLCIFKICPRAHEQLKVL